MPTLVDLAVALLFGKFKKKEEPVLTPASIIPDEKPVRSIEERFQEFHENNPQVYDTLVALAKEQVEAGAEKIGIHNLWEVMRWKLGVNTKTKTLYKFNDHYTSRYARLIMENESGLANVFETRKLRAA